MGRFSYSQSSSSRASFSSGCCRADGEFGIPKRCSCGGQVIEETSFTETDPGRRYFTCRLREEPGYHIQKWWDHAVEDELIILRRRIEEQTENIQSIGRTGRVLTCGDDTTLETMRVQMQNNVDEIAKLKVLVAGLAGLFLFVATVFYLFK